MAYLALYRKYRPVDFDGVIGQEHITTTLKNQIMQDKIGHAYLFCGTRGTGKTTVAKIFARAVNCLSPKNGSPCGKCKACVALSENDGVDIIEMDAASNNSVDDLRELKDKVAFQPVVGKYKIYIIDEVHMLSTSAFNALLKTLEEPPKHVIFVLATTEVQKIPATILSRCMRFDFKLIPTKMIFENIKRIYAEIGKEADDEALYAIAKAGEGSMRDALSIADMCLSSTEGRLTFDNVSETIGNLSRDVLFELFEKLIEGDGKGILSCVDGYIGQGKNIPVVAREIASLFRDLLVVKYVGNADSLNLPLEVRQKTEELAKKAEISYLLRGLDVLCELEAKFRGSFSQRIILETALLKLTSVENDLSLSAINRRLSLIEGGKVEVKVSSEKGLEKVDEKSRNENDDAEKKSKTPDDATRIKAGMLSALRKAGENLLHTALAYTECGLDGKRLEIRSQSADSIRLLKENRAILEESAKPLGIEGIDFFVKEKEDLAEEQKRINKAKALSGDMLEIKE